MDIIFISIISAILGFALGYFVTKRTGSEKNSGSEIELAAAQATITELRAQQADAKARIEGFEQRDRESATAESKYLQELRPLQAKLRKTIKPDVIIQLPDGKFVAVDAKVPYNNFQRAFEIPEVADATDEKRRKDLLKQHVSDVKKKIDDLNSAEYFSGLPSSPEFTILFMPSESLLSVTLEHDPTILEYAFQKRIALVSPVSFFSVLKTVSYTWKQNAQEDAIKEIIDLGVKLHSSVRVIAEHASKLGGKLNDSVKAYNEFAGSLETNLLKSTRDLNEEQKKILDKGKTIPELPGIEDTTRIFTKPELTAKDEPEA